MTSEDKKTTREAALAALGMGSPAGETEAGEPAVPRPRMAVVRLAFSAELEEVLPRIEETGARIQTSGKGVVVVAGEAASLERLVEIPGVVAVEEPRRLELKLPPKADQPPDQPS